MSAIENYQDQIHELDSLVMNLEDENKRLKEELAQLQRKAEAFNKVVSLLDVYGEIRLIEFEGNAFVRRDEMDGTIIRISEGDSILEAIEAAEVE